MTVYRLRFRGREIFSWEVEADSAELLATVIAELADDTGNDTADEEGGVSGGITGGGAHDFERDLAPLNAVGEEPWFDRFGFGQ